MIRGERYYGEMAYQQVVNTLQPPNFVPDDLKALCPERIFNNGRGYGIILSRNFIYIFPTDHIRTLSGILEPRSRRQQRSLDSMKLDQHELPGHAIEPVLTFVMSLRNQCEELRRSRLTSVDHAELSS